ncbi:MAG: DMT family transporter [Bacteroidetes bacterium]|nr:DMT family transporter [Bacteroidota bacterium]
MKSWKAKSLLLFGTAIWGGTFLFTQIGIQFCSPSLYLLFRFIIAILLCLIFFGKHIFKIDKKTVKQGVILGLFWTIGFLLQTFGLKYTTIGNAAFITSLTVGLTPFMYWFVTREKVKVYSKFAAIIGFIGVYVIANPSVNSFNIGDLLTFFSTFMWAGYISFLHVFTKNEEGIAKSAKLTTYQFVTGLPIIVIYILIFEPVLYVNITNELIYSLLFNAVIASFVVSFIQIAVQRYTTPISAVLIFALEPVFASIISFFAIGELLSFRGYIGAGIMLFAIFINDTAIYVINYFKKLLKV